MKIKTLPFIIYSFILISFSYALDGDTYDFFLPNGLKVILMEKHAAPKAAVSFFYNVGSHDEMEGQKGITNLVLDIIREGTSKNPRLEVENKLSKLQVEMKADVGHDKTHITLDVPIENIEFVLELGSDVMQNIIVTEDILNNAKDRYKARFSSFTNQHIRPPSFKNQYFEMLMLHEMIPEGHPYKTSPWGILEQFDTLSVQTCQLYLNTYFAPNNAVLIIVGNIIPEDVTKVLYQYFSKPASAEAIPPDPDLTFMNKPDKIIKFHLTEKTVPYISIIGVNFICPSKRHDDAIILSHLNEILWRDISLPGDISNMFTKNNRLLTWGPFPYFFSPLGSGIFGVAGFNIFRNGSLNKIQKNILETFEFIGENGIGEEVLNQHKKYKLLESYIDGYSYFNIAYQLGYAEIIYGDYRTYNREIEILKNLSNEDIKRVVNTYLISDNMYTYHVTVNEKSWYTPIVSFFFNIVTIFWTPPL